MADRFYGYQYGANARKLNPEYSPYRKRYPKEEEPVKTTNRNNSKAKKGPTAEKRSKSDRIDRTKGKSSVQEKRVPEYRREQVTSNRLKSNTEVNRKSKVQEDSTDEKNKNSQQVKVSKTNIKARLKILALLFAGFSVLFAISYQNSLISESFNRKEQYKKEMEALSKTNQQIEVSIENNLNLNNIEQVAKERLGMQKLGNDQKIYVNLPKTDYVAPAAEQIVIEEDLNFFQKLIRGFKNVIK